MAVNEMVSLLFFCVLLKAPLRPKGGNQHGQEDMIRKWCFKQDQEDLAEGFALSRLGCSYSKIGEHVFSWTLLNWGGKLF